MVYPILLPLIQKLLSSSINPSITFYILVKLYQPRIVSYSKCFFCDIHDETPLHLFHECVYAQNIWNQLKLYLAEKNDLLILTPHKAIFGFVDVQDQR